MRWYSNLFHFHFFFSFFHLAIIYFIHWQWASCCDSESMPWVCAFHVTKPHCLEPNPCDPIPESNPLVPILACCLMTQYPSLITLMPVSMSDWLATDLTPHQKAMLAVCAHCQVGSIWWQAEVTVEIPEWLLVAEALKNKPYGNSVVLGVCFWSGCLSLPGVENWHVADLILKNFQLDKHLWIFAQLGKLWEEGSPERDLSSTEKNHSRIPVLSVPRPTVWGCHGPTGMKDRRPTDWPGNLSTWI